MSGRTRRRWSLRRRLVVAIVALLAVVGVIVGTVSVLALRQNLVARLDSQLAGVITAASAPGGRIPDVGENTEDGFRLTGTVVVVADGDQVRGAYLAAERPPMSISAVQQQRLLRVEPGGAPQTITLAGMGAFRVQSMDTQFGTLVVGLSMAEVNATTANLAVIFGLVTLATLILAGVIATLVVRVALRPLGRVAETATRVAELPLATGAVALAERVPEGDTDPGTEVGQVGAALNLMLGHVEQALQARQASEQKVRQFVADASHELRTPLSSIRGYSELTRRSGEKLPPDIAHALSRIESESIRMTGLVEDLLLLARLDEGRELVLSEVDLVPLIADAVGDARAVGQEHRWKLDTPGHPVIVEGDAARLHQVIGNLLANAHRHTPAGTLVSVELHESNGWAIVIVEDDGPGIPESLQPSLFERFARGDGSRSRETGSTGLGLAIVAAVVEAHHGEVAAESAPGRTRFTVRLPLGVPDSREADLKA
jgi:two-component system OmpR family sensor kinase